MGIFETRIAHAIGRDDFERVGELFAEVSQTSKGRWMAWTALGAFCERAASGQSIKRSPTTFFQREIRQLGPVVAWTESRVLESRDLEPAKQVELRILRTTDAANTLVASELDGASCQWGYRPAKDELPDLRAHEAERARLIQQGDVSALDAYAKRYTRPVLLSTEGRLRGSLPYVASNVLSQVAYGTADLRVVEWALGLGGLDSNALGHAAGVAIERDQTAVLEAILARSTEPEPPIYGSTLLAVAARERRPAAVRLLLARGAKPDVACGPFRAASPTRAEADGDGPLVNAVRNGDVAIVELLLAAKADPLAKTYSGRRVLDMARELGDASVVEALDRAAGAAAVAPVDMITAVASVDVERVLALLPAEGSSEPIQQWAQCGKAAELRRVLESGAPHDAAALAKALWFASGNGYLEVVQLLLAHEADPNAFTLFDETARASAKKQGHAAIVAALQKAGGKLRA